jgi:hypothetical protein
MSDKDGLKILLQLIERSDKEYEEIQMDVTTELKAWCEEGYDDWIKDKLWKLLRSGNKIIVKRAQILLNSLPE